MKKFAIGLASAAVLFGESVAFAQQAEDRGAARAQPGGSDHDSMVGRLGVGYLGRETLLIASGAPPGPAAPTEVTAPVGGVRYWLSPLLGIDAGVGLAATSGSTATDAGMGETSTDKVGVTAFLVHVGVPLALASASHFSFQVVPEANLGFAGATATGVGAAPDTNFSGFHLDLGARVGGEIHFGFIGIPQLSLQAGLGFGVQIDNVSATTESDPEVSSSDNTTTLGTTLAGDPWDIFLGNLSAIFYL